jgi:hypothetical protein
MQYEYGHAVRTCRMHMQPCRICINAMWSWTCSMDVNSDMQHVLVHAAFPCPSCRSVPKLHIHVHAAYPSLCFFQAYAAIPYLCCISLSMLHVYVHAACPCTCCMSLSMLHVHVHAACPCPCCISMSMEENILMQIIAN